ncbi:MAG TPA: carbohydrate ABC transporter permease [Mycobacteriales bacterium]|nr:carbohydrate ABC transporter permease [Mycobacteriales bacterium]
MTSNVAVAGHRRKPRQSGHLAVHVVLSIGALLMIAPFLLELLISVETMADATAVPLNFVPHIWRWSNYSDVFHSMPFSHMLLNTLLMTVARTLGQLVFCSLAGYAFARLRFRGSGLVFGLFLSVLMVPSQLFLIPQYEIIKNLHLLNSLPALFLPGIFSAFGTFLMRQFFLQLPRELQEAAYIDGAGAFQTYWRVLLPLARPGLVALAILVIIWSWNDLLWPLVVNTDPQSMPVSAGLATLQGQYLTNYPVLMAGSLMASLPLIIVFIFFQRHFIEGIAFSAAKG